MVTPREIADPEKLTPAHGGRKQARRRRLARVLI